ncbi:hypothetical protein [Escherichia phage phiWec179]|nr:hypothetical protein [Escherichia phage phiWec179]BDU12341.1 hypothetical protein [Escherichia phage phiWec181]BDU12781.1 hypothetical protein [Escherichia phage phiWec186]
MFKKILKWFSTLSEPRSDTLNRSLTGEALLVVTLGSWGAKGFAVKQTDVGIQGSLVNWKISQVGDNRQPSIDLLKGEYDYCLTQIGKDHLIEVIRDRLEREGGYYFETKRNAHGTLDFNKVYWDTKTVQRIEKLLEEYYDSKLS